ncbi:MAG: hypothetical protein ACP6IY_20785, partial [Promethearchaeia archaeon]
DWFNSLVEDFLKLLSDLVAFVLETIAAAAEAIAETAKKVAEAGLKLIEAVVRAAMAVLEQLLKASLLILANIILALTLLSNIQSFPQVISIFSLISMTEGYTMKIKFLYIKLENKENINDNVEYHVYFDWFYVDFVDLKLPFMISEIRKNDKLIIQEIEPLFLGSGGLISNGNSSKSSQEIQNSNSSAYDINSNLTVYQYNGEVIFIEKSIFEKNFLWGFSSTFALLGVILGILIAVHSKRSDKIKYYTNLFLAIATILLYVLNIIIWTIEGRFLNLLEKAKLISYVIGVLTALLFVGTLLKLAFGGKKEDFIELVNDLQFWILAILRIINLIIGYLNLFLKDVDWYSIKTALLIQVSIFAGIVFLAHFFISNIELRKNLNIFGKYCLFSGLGLFTIILTYYSVFTISAFFDFLFFYGGTEYEK